MKIKTIIALSLLSLLLLSSCNVQTPEPTLTTKPTTTATTTTTDPTTDSDITSTPPIQTTPTPTLDILAPNERTITNKVYYPHDFELTLTTDKESYAPGENVKVLITVKNIGEDYTVPEVDVFSDVKLYYLIGEPPVVIADAFELSDAFSENNRFPKGSVIRKTFSFSLPSDLPVSCYNFSMYLFGSKINFDLAVTVFYNPDVTWTTVRTMCEKTMKHYCNTSVETLKKHYKLRVNSLDNGFYEVYYFLYFGNHRATYYSFELDPVNAKVTNLDEGWNYQEYKPFIGEVTEQMLKNAEKRIISSLNDYLEKKGNPQLTDENTVLFLELYNGSLKLCAEIILEDDSPEGHSHAMFSEIICVDPDDITWDKPVIYLYPQAPTDVTVKLGVTGELSFTYPEYNGGWNVTAYPDGTIIDKSTGKEYSYLFWESRTNIEFDMTEGFVVKGEDTAEFLQETLAKIGLTPREYNEMIVYWLPKMQNNKYNLITFQTEAYTDNAKLYIDPAPDSILRVFMAFKPLDEPVNISKPSFEMFERRGFTVVEWGGTEIR